MQITAFRTAALLQTGQMTSPLLTALGLTVALAAQDTPRPVAVNTAIGGQWLPGAREHLDACIRDDGGVAARFDPDAPADLEATAWYVSVQLHDLAASPTSPRHRKLLRALAFVRERVDDPTGEVRRDEGAPAITIAAQAAAVRALGEASAALRRDDMLAELGAAANRLAALVDRADQTHDADLLAVANALTSAAAAAEHIDMAPVQRIIDRIVTRADTTKEPRVAAAALIVTMIQRPTVAIDPESIRALAMSALAKDHAELPMDAEWGYIALRLRELTKSSLSRRRVLHSLERAVRADGELRDTFASEDGRDVIATCAAVIAGVTGLEK